MEPQFCTIADLATRYGVCTITIRRWFAAGHIPKPVRIGGSLRWAVADIYDFEERGYTMPAESDTEATASESTTVPA